MVMKVDGSSTGTPMVGSFAADETATVQQNESSVTQLAQRLGISEAALLAANPNILDPQHLKVGQEIALPEKVDAKKAADAPAVLPETQGKYSGAAKMAEYKFGGQLQEMILRGKMNSGTLYATPGGPPLTSGVGGPTKAAASAVDVRATQQSINKWRTENGQTPIKETGVEDADTARAIRDFQKDSGMHPIDGKNGPATQQRLTLMLDILKNNSSPTDFVKDQLTRLRNSDGFRTMESSTQTEVLKRMLKDAVGPDKLDNIRLMNDMITEPGFEKLPRKVQNLAVHAQGARPDDMDLSDNMRQLLGSDEFTGLDEPTQQSVLRKIRSYGGDRAKIDNLENLITTTSHFQDLPKETREAMLSGLAGDPANAALESDLARAGEDLTLRGLAPDLQAQIMNAIPQSPRGRGTLANLLQVAQDPGFAAVPRDIQDRVLSNVPYLYETTPLNAANLPNFMKVITASGFEKLPQDTRDLMVATLASRPDNADLAEALADLANNGRFRHEQRLQRKAIMDVDDRIKTP